MKVEFLQITQIDDVIDVQINGQAIVGVKEYKLSSSAKAGAELELKIDINGADLRLESLTS